MRTEIKRVSIREFIANYTSGTPFLAAVSGVMGDHYYNSNIRESVMGIENAEVYSLATHSGVGSWGSHMIAVLFTDTLTEEELARIAKMEPMERLAHELSVARDVKEGVDLTEVNRFFDEHGIKERLRIGSNPHWLVGWGMCISSDFRNEMLETAESSRFWNRVTDAQTRLHAMTPDNAPNQKIAAAILSNHTNKEVS